MYDIGYTAYGLKIVNIIYPKKKVLVSRTEYIYHDTYYYVKIYRYIWKALWEYQLDSLIAERKNNCIQVINLVTELKIKLMLEKKYEG